MKIKDMLEDVKTEMTEDKAEVVKEQLKVYIDEIDSCKKTLAKLEKRFNKYVEQDISDINVDDETMDY